MTLQQEIIPRVAAQDALPLDVSIRSDAMLTKRERQMVERLPGSGGVLVRASIPLNVMGGIAECAGALLLHSMLAETVSVAVRPNAAGQVLIHWCEPEQQDGAPPFHASITDFQTTGRQFLPAADIVERFGRKLSRPGLALLAALVEGLREGLLPPSEAGWRLGGVGCPGLSTVSAVKAPLVTALLQAASTVAGVKADPRRIAEIAVTVQQDWLGWPVGVGDAHAATTDSAIGLLQFRSDARCSAGFINLPADLEIVAVDCGAEAADARLTNQRVRAAATMGRVLVQRIMEHDTGDLGRWTGHLSGLSMTDYVGRFRDRLPTKMKGREFLDRFGDPGDAQAPLEPGYLYKVRSRTEHMVYEHARATHFAELLSRGVRTSDSQAFVDAGELMYASHWSYGQRCGLGGVETDFLVSQLRQAGKERDILGAKACGRGCGGMVAVLMRATPVAEQSLAEVCGAYQQKMKQSPRVLRGATGPKADLGPLPI